MMVNPHKCRTAAGIVCKTIRAMKHGRKREESGSSLPWSLRERHTHQPVRPRAAGAQEVTLVIVLSDCSGATIKK